VTKPFNVEELRKVISRALKARELARESELLLGRLETIREEMRQARRNGGACSRRCLPEQRPLGAHLPHQYGALHRHRFRRALPYGPAPAERGAEARFRLADARDRRSQLACYKGGPGEWAGAAGVGQQPISYGVAGWVASTRSRSDPRHSPHAAVPG